MLRRLAVAVLAAVSLVATPPAFAAPEPAYCNPVAGTVSYSPILDTTTMQRGVTFALAGTCVGVSHDAGAYVWNISGEEMGNCAFGQGRGGLSGTGPSGALTGHMEWIHFGVHYYMTGVFSSGGHDHDLFLWIDYIGVPPCPITTGPVQGHGAVASRT